MYDSQNFSECAWYQVKKVWLWKHLSQGWGRDNGFLVCSLMGWLTIWCCCAPGSQEAWSAFKGKWNRNWLHNSLLQYSTTNNQWVLGRRKRSLWGFWQIAFSHLDGCPCVVCVEMRLPCPYLAHLVIMSLLPFVKLHSGGRILFGTKSTERGRWFLG